MARDEVGSRSRRSSVTRVEVDEEKGLHGEKQGGDAKLVVWKENDLEDPRNWSHYRKWYVRVKGDAGPSEGGAPS